MAENDRTQSVRERTDELHATVWQQRAEQHECAEARKQLDEADPQTLRGPIGKAGAIHHPIERAHRPEVADLLMSDRAAGDRGIPQRGRAPQQTARIEIQILLGVCIEPSVGTQ